MADEGVCELPKRVKRLCNENNIKPPICMCPKHQDLFKYLSERHCGERLTTLLEKLRGRPLPMSNEDAEYLVEHLDSVGIITVVKMVLTKPSNDTIEELVGDYQETQYA